MNQRLQTLTAAAAAALERAAVRHAPCVLASSLSPEDMVLTDLILEAKLPIGIFTLDTGRLHDETLALIRRIEERWDCRVQVYRPDAAAVEAYVARHGANGFYASPELRKSCCEIRKVEPLRRALAGQAAWITGMRREQSAARDGIAEEEYDPAHGLWKLNPLADWLESDVQERVRERALPANRLLAEGYRSIGCAPCTRPVTPFEDPRAGRWWWEQSGERECGLHVGPDGRLQRARRSSTETA